MYAKICANFYFESYNQRYSFFVATNHEAMTTFTTKKYPHKVRFVCDKTCNADPANAYLSFFFWLWLLGPFYGFEMEGSSRMLENKEKKIDFGICQIFRYFLHMTFSILTHVGVS